jgi:hypothetical protein
LTNHPDVYLSASLVHAYVFREAPEKAQMWDLGYREAVEAIQEKEARSVAVAPLVADPAILAVRRRVMFNYTIGQ